MTAPKTHTPSADAQAAKDLLEWLRSHRIAITDLTIGSVVITGIADYTLAAAIAGPPKPTDGDLDRARSNLYEQFGGDAIEAANKADEAVYEDDDE